MMKIKHFYEVKRSVLLNLLAFTSECSSRENKFPSVAFNKIPDR